jgi:hypothetical protein
MRKDGAFRKERAYAAARRRGTAVFVGRERKEGWRAALPMYVIWCETCQRHTESHLAGYGRITCSQCRKHTVRRMTWARFRDKELRPFLAMAPIFLAIGAAGIGVIMLLRSLLSG